MYHLNILDKTNIYPTTHTENYAGDSGIDLYFPEDVVVPGGNIAKTHYINLRISCEMIKNETQLSSYYLYPRSSISKTPLILANSVGIIDAGYRGDIIAAVKNLQPEDYHIKKGERLFQICAPDLSPVKWSIVQTLSQSDRSDAGFGSTGK